MSPSRGRPVEYPIKKLVALNQPIIDAVEAFRDDQSEDMNQSEAIRRILKDWLTGKGYLPADAD